MLPQFTQAFQGDEHKPFKWEGGRHAALLVHGFPGSPAEMHPIAIMLHEANWTVQTILLPGFGADIETLPDRRATDWVQTVSEAYTALQREYDGVVLVGLSMGGAIAMQVAAQHQPTALMLFAPFWQVDHILWKALPVLKFIFPTFKPFRLFKPDFNDPRTQQSIHEFIPQADLDDPAVRKGILDFVVPVGMIDQVRIVGQQAYEIAPQIQVPTLIVQGTDDELVRPAMTQKLAQRFAGAVDYVEVEDGHELIKPHAKAWSAIQHAVRTFTHKHHLGDASW